MFALCICWYKKYIRYRYNSLHKYMWIYIYIFIFLHTWHHITSHHNAVHNIMLHMYHNVCTGCMDIICVHYNIKCICTVEININIYIHMWHMSMCVCPSATTFPRASGTHNPKPSLRAVCGAIGIAPIIVARR